MATLKARLREGTGKSVTRKLRAAGEIPAVAYGHGVAGRPLSVNGHELELLLNSINPENTIIELKVEGSKPVQALIREVQSHPSRPIIYHVDFFQVKAGEKLQVEIPIRLHGTPRGVSEGGGMLQEILRELSVECLPRNIPTSIDLDIEGLDVGDSIHVSDVTIEDATILNATDLVICTVGAPTLAELPEDAEEAAADEEAEPEVIRERRDGGEGGTPGEAGESE
jgi:large subunit ribosomal protein L25